MFLDRLGFSVAALIVVVSFIAADEYKIVETRNGQVRGVQKTTLNGVPYHSFKGIPYAKPPIGDLRLKAPEPIESWKPTILDAFEHGRICMQPDAFLKISLPQSEDCLTLNVYVPADVNPDERLAVLFFIHGGAYSVGFSDDYIYSPDFIVEKRTILVTTNYRVGLLGFLSLDAPEYSGNMGLKDQQLALKWINANIGRFSGDNERITIFGQSAGGSSVHFHILSAESRKYYHNAISMSGVVDNFWAMSESSDHLKLAYQVASELGEPKNTYEELVEYFKTVPAEKIVEYNKVFMYSPLLEFIITPIVERKDAKQPFLTESPEKVYETSNVDVDVMFSMTSSEMIFFLPLIPTLQDIQENNISLPLPFRGLKIDADSEEYRNLTSEILKFYLRDATSENEAFEGYAAMLSDMNFGYGINKAVEAHATKSSGKTYYYWFSVDSKLNIFKRMVLDLVNLPGASHGDDLFYLFRCQMAESGYDEIKNNKNDEESKISLQTINHISEIITNFAKYGEPSFQGKLVDGFRPVQNGEINFLDIHNGGLTVGQNPNKEAFEMWANIEKRAHQLSAGLHKHERDEL